MVLFAINQLNTAIILPVIMGLSIIVFQNVQILRCLEIRIRWAFEPENQEGTQKNSLPSTDGKL
jgi:hypothetical protein